MLCAAWHFADMAVGGEELADSNLGDWPLNEDKERRRENLTPQILWRLSSLSV